MTSFIAFMTLLGLVVVVLFFKVRQSREIDQKREEVARTSLFAIGSTIESVHEVAASRTSTHMTPPPAANSWYPDRKRHGARQ